MSWNRSLLLGGKFYLYSNVANHVQFRGAYMREIQKQNISRGVYVRLIQ